MMGTIRITCEHKGLTIPIVIPGVRSMRSDGWLLVVESAGSPDDCMWSRDQFDSFYLHEVHDIEKIGDA